LPPGTQYPGQDTGIEYSPSHTTGNGHPKSLLPDSIRMLPRVLYEHHCGSLGVSSRSLIQHSKGILLTYKKLRWI